jgi:hypothetical protein
MRSETAFRFKNNVCTKFVVNSPNICEGHN